VHRRQLYNGALQRHLAQVALWDPSVSRLSRRCRCLLCPELWRTGSNSVHMPGLPRAGRIEISAQNHNFAVDPASLPEGVEVTHINLNDGTCAGMLYAAKRAMSIQYHPEASPGERMAGRGKPGLGEAAAVGAVSVARLSGTGVSVERLTTRFFRWVPPDTQADRDLRAAVTCLPASCLACLPGLLGLFPWSAGVAVPCCRG
jgi:Glutamine amidotransferase class-I